MAEIQSKSIGAHLALVGVFLLAFLTAGCNPQTLSMLLMPFFPDDMPPKMCKISEEDKEITIAIVSRFSEPQLHPALMTADQEIADFLAANIARRAKENKEKIKLVPQSRVRSYLTKPSNSTASLEEIGKQLKADKVIGLEINSLSIYVPRSMNSLFQGRANIDVKLVEFSTKEGEDNLAQTQAYTVTYPRDREEDAHDVPAAQFRSRLSQKIGKDIARFFMTYPKEDRLEIDELLAIDALL